MRLNRFGLVLGISILLLVVAVVPAAASPSRPGTPCAPAFGIMKIDNPSIPVPAPSQSISVSVMPADPPPHSVAHDGLLYLCHGHGIWGRHHVPRSVWPR